MFGENKYQFRLLLFFASSVYTVFITFQKHGLHKENVKSSDSEIFLLPKCLALNIGTYSIECQFNTMMNYVMVNLFCKR